MLFFSEFVTLMDKVALNNNEQKRLLLLNEVLAGWITGRQAAEIAGLSFRHTRWLIAAYRRMGPRVAVNS